MHRCSEPGGKNPLAPVSTLPIIIDLTPFIYYYSRRQNTVE